MWRAMILGFLGGLFGANGVPHFVKGITKESYPCVLGNSPVPNLVGGWASLVLSVLLIGGADVERHRFTTLLSGAVGALLIGLFHASVGAFGRKGDATQRG